MTQDEIIEMAEPCGLLVTQQLEAFAKLVEAKAAERERNACAKRAEIALLGTLKTTSERVLKAIRARGET